MIRRFASRCLLAGMLAVLAAPAAPTASAAVYSGSATGTVIAVSGNSLTIQTAGRQVGVINALTAAANRVTNRDYPYVYGGGHAMAGVASVGIRGPGHNGHRIGFDCSGSVAAVLAGAGLWPAGGGVPNDAGIIATLRNERLIARGVGRGPSEVTLYDDPGVHIFMNIDGRFFGTSDGAGGGNARGGAGWLDDGASDASSRAYRPYHFRSSVLRGSTSSGHILSFQVGALQSIAATIATGDTVQVTYQENSSGAMVATAIVFPGASTTSGTVTSIAPDGSSFTIQIASGASLTLSSVNDPELLQDVVVGDSVQVTYTTSSGALTARAVTVTATPTDNTTGSTDPAAGN